jgi:hypothetical protein
MSIINGLNKPYGHIVLRKGIKWLLSQNNDLQDEMTIEESILPQIMKL